MKTLRPTWVCVYTDWLVEIWNRFIFKALGIYSALRHLLKLTGRLAGHLKGDRIKKSATLFRTQPGSAARGSRRNQYEYRRVTYRVHGGASLEVPSSNETDYTCKRCNRVDVCLSSSLSTHRHLSGVTENFNEVRTQKLVLQYSPDRYKNTSGTTDTGHEYNSDLQRRRDWRTGCALQNGIYSATDGQ